MTKQQLPAVSLLSAETLEEFKTTDNVVLVAYFAADDKTSNQTYSKVAESLRDDYIFGATNDVALATAAGVKQPALVLYKTFDSGKEVFSETFTEDAITSFTKTASIPLVGEVGPETYAGYMAVSSPRITLIDFWTDMNHRLKFLLPISSLKLPKSVPNLQQP